MTNNENRKESKIAYLISDDRGCIKSKTLLLEMGYEVQVFISSQALYDYLSNEGLQDTSNKNNSAEFIEATKGFESLTKREKEVVRHLVLGEGESSNKAIAKEMSISHRTVEEYRASAMRKMSAKSFKELITKVIDYRLFEIKS